jgi:Fur family peroxide stress response transcriptional regulator
VDKNDYGLGENLRLTKQRRVILDILRATDTHPTADWVYSKARRQIKNVSLGTIYRNLNLMTKESLIKKFDFGFGLSRFDGCMDPHSHLICDNCGAIIDLPAEHEPEKIAQLENKTGFSIHSYEIELHGICPKCKLESEIIS